MITLTLASMSSVRAPFTIRNLNVGFAKLLSTIAVSLKRIRATGDRDAGHPRCCFEGDEKVGHRPEGEQVTVANRRYRVHAEEEGLADAANN